MTSLFPFRRRRNLLPDAGEPVPPPPPDEPLPASLPPGEEPIALPATIAELRAADPAPEAPAALAAAPGGRRAPAGAAAAAGAFDVSGGGETPAVDLTQFVRDMLLILSDAAGLPRAAGGAPNGALGLVELVPRPLGLGNLRGMTTTAGGFVVSEDRGGWLEAVVRFDISGNDLAAVNAEGMRLQTALLGQAPTLRGRGLRQLRMSGTAEPPLAPSDTVRRRTLDYKVLYEYHYVDNDGAASLIARIPVESETDLGSLSHEHLEVRDWMVRWDDQGVPPLEVSTAPRSSLEVRGLAIAAFLPGGGPAGTVTQTLVQGGSQADTDLGTLAAFLNQFNPSASQTLKLIFPPLPLGPGETLGVREYQVGEMVLDPPVVLGGGDLFRISFGQPFPAGTQSVVYLRALTGRAAAR